MRNHSFNLRILLAVIIMLTGMLTAVLCSWITIGLSEGNRETSLRQDIKKNTEILSRKLSSRNYLGTRGQDENLNIEIADLADFYSGRIVIVDRSFRILRDSFRLADNRFAVAPEIVRCMQGNDTDRMNEEKSYLLQTTAIASVEDPEQIDGVILFTVPSADLRKFSVTLKRRVFMLLITVFVILLPISILLGGILLRPFEKLRDSLRKIANGNLNDTIEQKDYTITGEISEAVNGTIRRLRTVDESRDEFVANVSHELKTPITSMQVLADSLNSMEEVPNELYKEFMEDISEEVTREANIIDDLLELVKMDKSKATIRPKPVDVNEMIRRILRRIRPLAERKNIELIFESVRNVTADGDETKLSLAVTNIIDNAVKYSENGGHVRVILDADHKNCIIKVDDDGIGIPEEAKELVFERFYRVDKARSRESGGTGLGLAITKNIVLLHHGSISLENKKEGGTVFTVLIPLNYIDG